MAKKAGTIVSVDYDTQRVSYKEFGTDYVRTDRWAFLSKVDKIAAMKFGGFVFQGKPPLQWNNDELAVGWDRLRKAHLDGRDTPTPAPKVPTVPKEDTMPNITTPTEGGLDALLRSAIMSALGDFVPEPDADKIVGIVNDAVAPVLASNATLEGMVSQLADAVDKRLPRVTEIRLPDREVRKIEGVLHHKFTKIMSAVSHRRPVYLVGPAGTGKSTIGEQVAEALGLAFYALSLSAQTTASDLRGFVDANGNYREAPLYKAYKTGGVLVLDEVDNGNPNVLSVLNTALSNGFMLFPNGEMVRKHDDFVAIATANTFGNGATAEYVGRNPLDKAFLNRFITIDIPIDAKVEEAMLESVGLPTDRADRWLKIVRSCRANVESNGLKVIVSPRATLNGAMLLTDHEVWTYREVAEATILSGLSPEQATKVTAGVSL